MQILRRTLPQYAWTLNAATPSVIVRVLGSGKERSVGMWVNWLLIIVGFVCIIIELALGALTGFDLALVGGSLTVGGAIGLIAGSENVGLLAGGALALIYLALFRRWLRIKLTVKNHSSNVDALMGKTGLVTRRIAASEAGMVKVGTEMWRAELADSADVAKNAGETVTVQAVDGVTIKVR